MSGVEWEVRIWSKRASERSCRREQEAKESQHNRFSFQKESESVPQGSWPVHLFYSPNMAKLDQLIPFIQSNYTSRDYL